MTTRFIPDPIGRENMGAGFVLDLNDADAIVANTQNTTCYEGSAVKGGQTHASPDVYVGGVGPTSGRAAWLAGAFGSQQATQVSGGYNIWYYDTTLGKSIWYDGTAFRDPSNGNTV